MATDSTARVETRVCVALIEGDPVLEHAVAAQDRSPGLLVRGPDIGSAVARAVREPADWIWVLDGSALPRADTLSGLLPALGRALSGPSPVLFASKVVFDDGSLVTTHLPWPRRGDSEVGLAASAHHAAPIRAAAGGSLLVAASAAARYPPPRPQLAPTLTALGWTARILRTNVGLIVPASAALVRVGHARPDVPSEREGATDQVRDMASLIRARAWAPREHLRLGAATASCAASLIIGQQASPLAVARAAARGLRTPA